jgi:RHS repeat-associated protein
VDGNGDVVERFVYDPFGKVTVLEADYDLKGGGSDYAWVYLYQGRPLDSVSGTYNFRRREVSPTLGRPIQVDMLRFASGDVNFYRWEGNGPLGSLDPSGLLAQVGVEVGLWMAGIIIGVSAGAGALGAAQGSPIPAHPGYDPFLPGPPPLTLQDWKAGLQWLDDVTAAPQPGVVTDLKLNRFRLPKGEPSADYTLVIDPIRPSPFRKDSPFPSFKKDPLDPLLIRR